MSAANGQAFATRERVVRFGESTPMIGIITEPTDAAAAAARPAVILVNSGIMHRVGACRWHVKVARRLAAEGFLVLRFDLSGIGDSEQRKDHLSFEESAPKETREAMDYLAKAKGATGFLLSGLCSGADVSHLAAVEDARVRGLALIDSWVYRTPGYWMHHYGPKLLSPKAWRRWLRVRAQRIAGARPGMGPTEGEGVEYEIPKYVRVFPPRDKVAADLRGFVARGVRMLVVFTDGLTDDVNHRGQYRRAFRDVRFGDLLEVEYMKGSTHIVTSPDHQAFVVERMAAWARHFAPAADTPVGAPSLPTTPARSLAATAR